MMSKIKMNKTTNQEPIFRSIRKQGKINLRQHQIRNIRVEQGLQTKYQASFNKSMTYSGEE